jgi:hypothetical protein
MSIGDLIIASLQELGVIAPGDSVPAELSALGLARVNDWIDDLANDGLSFFTETRTTWTLTGAASYSVGVGGMINVVRPASPGHIRVLGVVTQSTSPASEINLDLPLTPQEYASISQKAATGQPLRWYYDPTFPLGALKPWPLWDGAGSVLGVMYHGSPVTEFAALTDTVLLPNGYRRFYRTGLTMELAAMLDQRVDEQIVKAHRQAMARIKRSNTRMRELGFSADQLIGQTRGPSNVYSGN